MGDRTWVNIHICESDYQRIIQEDFGGDESKFESQVYFEEKADSHYGEGIIMFYASEVNYADWEDLESILKDKKIEYNKDWGDGGEYSAGEAFYRNIKGEYKSLEIYSSQQSELNILEEISKIIEEGGDLKKVKSFVGKRIKYYMPFTPKPLNNSAALRYIEED